MKEIRTIQNQSRGDMVKKINELYADGWTLLGPIQFSVNFVTAQDGRVHYLSTLERIVGDSE